MNIALEALEPRGEGIGGEVTPEKAMAAIVMMVQRGTMGRGESE